MGGETPEPETLEQYGERIAKATRKIMMDRLDDDVIGCLTDSHIIFGKACAMEAVTTAYREMDEYRKNEGAAALDDGWRPPAGWKLAPEEATPEMIQAAVPDLNDHISRNWATDAYGKMLAAAPPPPDRSEG